MDFLNLNIFLSIILATATSFVVSFVFIPTIIRMSFYKRLFDNIDERKVHKEKISRLGGVAIFSGFIIAVLLFVNIKETAYIGGLLVGTIILFFIGLKDDILLIAPFKKLMGQLVAALVLVFFGHTYITDLHGFFGIHQIHWTISIVLTLFVILVTINAFNFIDGIDGLSSSVGVVTTLAFCIWFVLSKEYNMSIIGFSLIAALIAFIRFNLFSTRLRIFMGDTGSMILGFVISFLAINFNEMNIDFRDNQYFILPAPAVAFGVLIIPYFDMLRVMYIRVLKGQKLFNADKNHLHHLFLKLGLSHKQVVLMVVVFNILFISLVYYLSSFVTIRRLLLLELLLVLLISFIPETIVRRKEKKKITTS